MKKAPTIEVDAGKLLMDLAEASAALEGASAAIDLLVELIDGAGLRNAKKQFLLWVGVAPHLARYALAEKVNYFTEVVNGKGTPHGLTCITSDEIGSHYRKLIEVTALAVVYASRNSEELYEGFFLAKQLEHHSGCLDSIRQTYEWKGGVTCRLMDKNVDDLKKELKKVTDKMPETTAKVLEWKKFEHFIRESLDHLSSHESALIGNYTHYRFLSGDVHHHATLFSSTTTDQTLHTDIIKLQMASRMCLLVLIRIAKIAGLATHPKFDELIKKYGVDDSKPSEDVDRPGHKKGDVVFYAYSLGGYLPAVVKDVFYGDKRRRETYKLRFEGIPEELWPGGVQESWFPAFSTRKAPGPIGAT